MVRTFSSGDVVEAEDLNELQDRITELRHDVTILGVSTSFFFFLTFLIFIVLLAR